MSSDASPHAAIDLESFAEDFLKSQGLDRLVNDQFHLVCASCRANCPVCSRGGR